MWPEGIPGSFMTENIILGVSHSEGFIFLRSAVLSKPVPALGSSVGVEKTKELDGISTIPSESSLRGLLLDQMTACRPVLETFERFGKNSCYRNKSLVAKLLIRESPFFRLTSQKRCG